MVVVEDSVTGRKRKRERESEERGERVDDVEGRRSWQFTDYLHM